MSNTRIANALITLRLGVFIVMLMWTLDKFVNPQHSAAVFDKFYGLGNIGPEMFMGIGALQLLLVLAFVTGFKKRVTYGAVLLLHGVSTLSSWQQYLDGFNNLLFFAAWPMLAACYTLYVLRDMDTRLTID